jgi:hypothetical protein
VPGRDAWSHAAGQPAALTPSDPRQRPVKAVYLSYYGVGDRTIRSRVLEMLDHTELNAVVIDVKGDRGFIPYESEVPLAREAGAMGSATCSRVRRRAGAPPATLGHQRY